MTVDSLPPPLSPPLLPPLPLPPLALPPQSFIVAFFSPQSNEKSRMCTSNNTHPKKASLQVFHTRTFILLVLFLDYYYWSQKPRGLGKDINMNTATIMNNIVFTRQHSHIWSLNKWSREREREQRRKTLLFFLNNLSGIYLVKSGPV